MSASTSDQRMKGQGNQSNGPKDSVNEQEDFDSWRNQPHQDYGVDQYISSYYGATYPHESFSAGAWSNTGAPSGEGVAFLGGSFGNFGQQGYNTSGYGYPGNTSGGEYSTWGRKPVYDEYYSSSGNRLEDQGSKTLEQGMHGLSLNRDTRKPGPQPESGVSSQPKKLTWASIASQPAKPQLTNKKKSMVPPPMIVPRIPSLDIGTWESKNGAGAAAVSTVVPPPSVPVPGVAKPTGPPPVLRQTGFSSPPRAAAPQRSPSSALPPMGSLPPTAYPPPPAPAILPPPMITNLPPPPAPVVPEETSAADPVLEELHLKHEYNPKDFDLSAKNARFFVIKSYSEDDIHRSIKYEIWCSTEHGNKRLDAAFRERDGKGPVYLFFSVNGSGHFCGMAEMTSPVDMSATLSVWSQDKWRGQFTVKWIYVKDVPNSALRHIRLENNENKPVTNSRDTQEVLPEKGRLVLRILHNYRHATSIFDDFTHYEKRQAEEDQRRSTVPAQQAESPYDDEIPKTRDRPELQDRDRDQGRGREQYRPPDRDRDQGRDREAYRPPDRDREMYRVSDRDRDQGRDRESYRMYDRDRDQGRSQEGYRGPDRDRDQGRGRGSYDYRDRDNRNSRDGYRGGRGGRGSRH